MSTSPHEQSAALPPSLVELQAGREEVARLAAENQLRTEFSSQCLDRRFVMSSMERNAGSWDQPFVDAGVLLSLEAVNLDPYQVVAQAANGAEREPVASRVFGEETLNIAAYGNNAGFIMRLSAESPNLKNGQPSEAIARMLRDRLLQSPAHQALIKAGQSLAETGAIPEQLSTESFDYRQDPLGSMVFFEDIGLTRSGAYGGLTQDIAAGMELAQLLDRLLKKVETSYGYLVDEQPDGSRVVTWQDGSRTLQRQIELRTDGTCVYRARQTPINLYLETANQAPGSRSLPFIETAAAQELSTFLDDAGLMFHPKLQYEMMQVGQADRYGSIYTRLSREVAKWVDNPSKMQLSNLFVPRDPAKSGAQLVTEYSHPALHEQTEDASDETGISATEASVRQAYQVTSRALGSEASEVLFTMIDDVMAIQQDPTRAAQTDIPVTSDYVQLRRGACFDVAAYYVGAAGNNQFRAGSLRNVRIGTVPMLEKTHGNHTFLATEPLQFNGVRLPKGSLFTQAEDGGWAFHRLTPFAFDSPADQLVFGSEMTKMFANQAEVLTYLGEATMQNLVEVADPR